jgi:hypothetical protein
MARETMTARQRQMLAEIGSGHITAVMYANGPSFWGPTLVFDNEDLQALAAAGLIHSEGKPKLTDAGRRALGGERDD